MWVFLGSLGLKRGNKRFKQSYHNVQSLTAQIESTSMGSQYDLTRANKQKQNPEVELPSQLKKIKNHKRNQRKKKKNKIFQKQERKTLTACHGVRACPWECLVN